MIAVDDVALERRESRAALSVKTCGSTVGAMVSSRKVKLVVLGRGAQSEGLEVGDRCRSGDLVRRQREDGLIRVEVRVAEGDRLGALRGGRDLRHVEVERLVAGREGQVEDRIGDPVDLVRREAHRGRDGVGHRALEAFARVGLGAESVSLHGEPPSGSLSYCVAASPPHHGGNAGMSVLSVRRPVFLSAGWRTRRRRPSRSARRWARTLGAAVGVAAGPAQATIGKAATTCGKKAQLLTNGSSSCRRGG